MDEGTNITVAAAQRHIIERPRLTKLLDESTARVILLVAPAGYGKTTLARQWMATKADAAWYSARPESADVAVLALGLARAAKGVAADAENRVRTFLAAYAGADVSGSLRNLLEEAFAEWPDHQWLVIDDYHSMIGTEAEEFVREVVEAASIRTLIASRARPTWVTVRQILYGEFLELDQSDLLMDETETRAVLVGKEASPVASLVALADGWPAVVGLAARTKGDISPNPLPNELHDYLAQELYSHLRPEVQEGLVKLSLSPEISHDLANELIGDQADEVLRAGLSEGFLSGQDGDVSMHPLLRRFLSSKATDIASTKHCARVIANHLLRADRWDAAFTVISSHRLDDLLSVLVRAATSDLLRSGRGATVSTWLDHARRAGISDPFFVVAESQLAFREGKYPSARRLSSKAVAGLEESDPAASRAWLNLAQSAYFDEAAEDAFRHFKRALDLAQTDEDKEDALWGAFSAATYLGMGEGAELLNAFEALAVPSTDFQLRVATAYCLHANALGYGEDALDIAERARSLLDATDNPMVRTAFLWRWAGLLVLCGRYDEAAPLLRLGAAEAKARWLPFVQPLFEMRLAACEAGRGRYSRAGALLDHVQKATARVEDIHLWLSILRIRAHLAAAGHAPERFTLSDFENDESIHWSPAYAEYLSGVALLRIAQTRIDDALELCERIESRATTLEPLLDAKLVRAIAAIQKGASDAAALAKGAYDLAAETGAWDGFVWAYRVSENFLQTVLGAGASVTAVSVVLHRAGDVSLARRLHVGDVETRHSSSALTPREYEVLQLVAKGFTNQEIAKALFVSPVTVKVHLRHVYEKLGVRSRTEAALRAQASDLI